ncbi:hypothetical protein IJT10_01575 [bacterium]|nr:hypothetical protein [bacterium]
MIAYRKLFIVTLLGFVCLGGCKEGSASDPKENANNSKPQISSTKEAKVVNKNHRKRYRKMSTEAVFTLLKIKNQSTGEEAEIVIDNSVWMPYASKIGIALEPIEAYRQYMLEHEDEPFVFPSETYERLQKYSVAQGDPNLANLTNEEILQKYFTEFEGSYVAKEVELRANRPFIRTLLERDFFVTIDCESGMLTVSP